MAKKLLNLIYPVIVLAVALLIWAAVANTLDKPLILPGVGETFNDAFKLLGKPFFYSAVSLTLFRAAAGFVLAFLCAFTFTALSAAFKAFKRVAMIIMSVLRSLPTLAAVLLFLIWTNSFTAPVIIAFLVVMPAMYSAFSAAVTLCPVELIETSRLYGRGRTDAMRSCYIPAMLSVLPESAASAFSMNLKLVIAAEILSQTAKSLGALMQVSQMYLETARLLALTVIAVILSALLEHIIRLALSVVFKHYL